MLVLSYQCSAQSRTDLSSIRMYGTHSLALSFCSTSLEHMYLFSDWVQYLRSVWAMMHGKCLDGASPENKKHCPNAALMLGQHCKR